MDPDKAGQGQRLGEPPSFGRLRMWTLALESLVRISATPLTGCGALPFRPWVLIYKMRTIIATASWFVKRIYSVNTGSLERGLVPRKTVQVLALATHNLLGHLLGWGLGVQPRTRPERPHHTEPTVQQDKQTKPRTHEPIRSDRLGQCQGRSKQKVDELSRKGECILWQSGRASLRRHENGRTLKSRA